jgi:hypothetical protein
VIQSKLPLVSPVRVLVTGSRYWTDRERLERELGDEVRIILAACHGILLRTTDPAAYLEERYHRGRVVFVLGDCPGGVDQLALEWCQDHSVDHNRFEVRPDLQSPRRYHERDRAMVEEGRPDRFLAFWDGRDPMDGEPSGTLHTMKLCVRAGVPGRIIPM